MKSFIIWVVIAVVFFGSVIYFAFSSDASLSITYIKFNINPEFIIGVNGNDEVKIYNPLNSDAKVLNLGMFNGKKLDSSMEIILKKLEDKGFLDVSQIDITVITKSQEKINYYYEMIDGVINKYNHNISLVNHEAHYDEILTYSNEVAYDLKPSYNLETLQKETSILHNEINYYINNLLNGLFNEEMTVDDKRIIIETKINENYFNNYNLTNYVFSNYQNLVIKPESKYLVSFTYDDVNVLYNIKLDLVLEYQTELIKNDSVYHVIEEYNFSYENNSISNLKNNFYKFK